MVGTKRPAPDNSALRVLEIKPASSTLALDANIELFRAEMTLAKAAAATAVVGLTAAGVGTRTVKILGFWLSVTGATAWTDATATKVDITDTDGTVIASFAKAALTGSVYINTEVANVTLGAALTSNFGKLTAGKGIQVVADAVFANGSDIQVMVHGIIE